MIKQFKNEKINRYVKYDTEKKKIVDVKRTKGAYKGIPHIRKK